jgi:hypothetical protein
VAVTGVRSQLTHQQTGQHALEHTPCSLNLFIWLVPGTEVRYHTMSWVRDPTFHDPNGTATDGTSVSGRGEGLCCGLRADVLRVNHVVLFDLPSSLISRQIQWSTT